MSRNASGTMSLTAGNPVVTDTVIDAGVFNTTMADVANEITNSLSRNGKGGMLVAFKNADGTVSAPGNTFTSEPTSGIYRASAGDIRQAILGVLTTRWRDATAESAGEQNPFQIWNGTAFVNPLTDDFTGAGTLDGTITITTVSTSTVAATTTLALKGGGTTGLNLTAGKVQAEIPLVLPRYTTAAFPAVGTLGDGAMAVNSDTKVAYIILNGLWVNFHATASVGLPTYNNTPQIVGFTAVADSIYLLDTATTGAFSIALPASPVQGTQVGYVDYARNNHAANVTWTSSDDIENSSGNYSMNVKGASGFMRYMNATVGWMDVGVFGQ